MDTRKLTAMMLFNLPQHFRIPIFQRPYVWDEESQWAPLWRDVARLAERKLAEPGREVNHFLGAVVLQSAPARAGGLTVSDIIDGQQRLTTMQILMDATRAVLARHGAHNPAIQLQGLTNNQPAFVEPGESTLKLRHMNRDRAAFDEVMGADHYSPDLEIAHASTRIARAHRFFREAVTNWLGTPEHPDFSTRASQLADVLQHNLQLVSIDLTPDEDSQEIFETLNARGTPLTAADLIRNYVFQTIEAEGGDSKRVYERDWPFETNFWEDEVSVGRTLVSRSSLFLNQWVSANVGDEISPHTTFSAFKAYVSRDDSSTMSELLPVIKADADWYEQVTKAATRSDGNLSIIEMAFYRMRASGIETLKPLLIWLAAPSLAKPDSTIARVVQSAESWVYRRQMLRLSNSDLGRLVADLIRTFSATDSADLPDRVDAYLSRLNVTTTYWPGDAEIRRALTGEAAYRRFPRARLRMFLEAVEDHLRSETKQSQVERGSLPIEHVLPRRWQETWPVETLEDATLRADHVHRLGNLTLLTTSLNSKLSNAPWEAKIKHLRAHNTILLTSRLLSTSSAAPWSEEAISQRTGELIQHLLSVWPTPQGHEGSVIDPASKVGDTYELRDLITAGLLEPGDRLIATHRDHPGREAEIRNDGNLTVDGVVYTSPSAAGRALVGRHTNGWYFWGLSDGRRLRDLRAELVAST